mgnify:CR=1 FL=1|jgi:hypothetical protein
MVRILPQEFPARPVRQRAHESRIQLRSLQGVWEFDAAAGTWALVSSEMQELLQDQYDQQEFQGYK